MTQEFKFPGEDRAGDDEQPEPVAPPQDGDQSDPPEQTGGEVVLDIAQGVSLTEFATTYGGREIPWPIMGAFITEKENAGQMSGDEDTWLAQVRAMGQRTVKARPLT